MHIHEAVLTICIGANDSVVLACLNDITEEKLMSLCGVNCDRHILAQRRYTEGHVTQILH